MSYYYFAATLPMLMPDQPPPFPVAEFRAQCETHLAPADLAALDALLDGQPAESTHPFSRRWQQADGQLRNAMARTRAERMRKNAADYIREIEGYDATMEEAVRDAFARPNPLAREQAIDRIRWAYLETLAGTDPFTSSALLAYGVQLTLLERWARMDKDTGAATVETLVQRTPADEEDKA